MKALALFPLLIILWMALPREAQGQARDTTAAAQRREQTREQNGPGLRGFRDENGNGLDDRIEVRGTGKGMNSKDRFIDADGDGICDTRAGGLGFRRGAGGSGSGNAAAPGKGTGSGKRLGQGGKR